MRPVLYTIVVIAVIGAVIALWSLKNQNPTVDFMVPRGDLPTIRVDRNAHVSSASGTEENYETEIGADPEDPNSLIACDMVYNARRAQFDIAAYRSRDAGKSWQLATRSDAFGSYDASCVMSNHRAFLSYISFTNAIASIRYSGGPKTMGMFFQRTIPGFGRWLPAMQFPVDDRSGVVADGSLVGVSGFENLVPGAGINTDSNAVVFYQSRDSARAFEPRRYLALPASSGYFSAGLSSGVYTNAGAFIVLSENVKPKGFSGDVGYVGDPEIPKGNLTVMVFPRDRQAPAVSRVVADWYFCDENTKLTMNIQPSLTIDRSSGPFRGRLYAAWGDDRTGYCQPMVAHSDDEGETWSQPVSASDDWAAPDAAYKPEDFLPEIAVNRDGVVGIMWYDRRDASIWPGVWARFSASIDGGETFLPSVYASEAPYVHGTNERLVIEGRPLSYRDHDISAMIAPNVFYYQPGHTAGITDTADGAFYLCWIDNRTGIPQAWGTRITVNGESIKNGSLLLARAIDVSTAVATQFSNERYDKSTNTMSANILFTNRSHATLQGPLYLRLISLTSKAGQPFAVNSENAVGSPGAIWKLANATLKPGQTSTPQELQFRLQNADSAHPPTMLSVNLTAKLFAQPANY